MFDTKFGVRIKVNHRNGWWRMPSGLAVFHVRRPQRTIAAVTQAPIR
jgi:phage tail sheath protein FI